MRGQAEQEAGWSAGSRRPHQAALPDSDQAGTYVRILEGICRAFASTSEPEEAQAATARWVREAVGQDATLRIRVLDESGQLQAVFSDRRSTSELLDRFSGPLEALRTRGPVTDGDRSSGSSIASIPMISRGEVIGVVEVVASRESIARAMPSLEAVASQAAIVFLNLRKRGELDREIRARGVVADLARQLITARSPEAAVAAVVGFCSKHGHAASAGWLCGRDALLMRLVAVDGLDADASGAVRQHMASIPRWDVLSPRQQKRILAEFSAFGGIERCVSIDTGEVIVLMGAQPSGLLPIVDELLRDVLDQLATVARADQRTKQLDLALAWTAHEFRGPLAGVKALIEQELDSQDPDARDTMEKLHTEVVHLLRMVDPVLDSAVGSAQLQRQPSSLVRLAKQATSGLDQGAERDRVLISGSSHVIAPVDRALFRSALSNVILNALRYSPPATDVAVSVRVVGDRAQISVTNRGPEIERSERELIFDPFIRGHASRSHPGGRGLGLFIARRTMEAHGGRIRVKSSSADRTVFELTVPLDDTDADVDVDVVNLIDPGSRVLDRRS